MFLLSKDFLLLIICVIIIGLYFEFEKRWREKFKKPTPFDCIALCIEYIKYKLFGHEIDITQYINDKRLIRKLKDKKIIVERSLKPLEFWVYYYILKGHIFWLKSSYNDIKDVPIVIEAFLWHELYHTKRFKKKSNTELYADQYSFIRIIERYGVIGMTSIISSYLYRGVTDSEKKFIISVLNECNETNQISKIKLIQLR